MVGATLAVALDGDRGWRMVKVLSRITSPFDSMDIFYSDICRFDLILVISVLVSGIEDPTTAIIQPLLPI